MAWKRMLVVVPLILANLPVCAGGPAAAAATTPGEIHTPPAPASTAPGRSGSASPNAPEPKRGQELRAMLIQDCGSCHGGTLKGGLGPPLTAEALAGRNAHELARVILDGRQGTPMAPWKLFLSEPEAEWLARQLLSGKWQ